MIRTGSNGGRGSGGGTRIPESVHAPFPPDDRYDVHGAAR
jgi:hypothetical protein